MSRSTWNDPNHLFIFSIWMATSSETFICGRSASPGASMLACASVIDDLLVMICPELALKIERVLTHGEAADEEEHADEDEELPVDAVPVRRRPDRVRQPDRVKKADEDDERRVLEEPDEG